MTETRTYWVQTAGDSFAVLITEYLNWYLAEYQPPEEAKQTLRLPARDFATAVSLVKAHIEAERGPIEKWDEG